MVGKRWIFRIFHGDLMGIFLGFDGNTKGIFHGLTTKNGDIMGV